MAVQHGYGKIAGADALVFAYDTGDTRNSYKGKPATNLLTTISKGNTNTPLFRIIPGQEVKNVPGMGKRTVEYVDIYNDFNGGSGNCCPAPMFFGDFTVSPSTVYTYQIVYKTATGYAHPNYMYHYEYNGGTYVTEYGLWNSGRIQDLGNGWKHAWGTFTSNASTNRFICSLFHYEYATQNRIEVAGVMLTQGNSIIPPPQFLSVNTTRSATQGLLDLTGNSSIDLINAGFDSNAQLDFDGTSDVIYSPQLPVLDSFSLEVIIKPDALTGWILYRNNSMNYTDNDDNFTFGFSSNKLYGHVEYNPSGADVSVNSTTTLSIGQHAHSIYTYDNASKTLKIYVNGVLEGTTVHTGDSYPYRSTQKMSIGADGGSNHGGIGGNKYFYNGKIPVVKVYNRALTAAEVANNYNHYKERFNI
jgi:hypothetical protein